jgi:adenosylhomocysteine nucleosidase
LKIANWGLGRAGWRAMSEPSLTLVCFAVKEEACFFRRFAEGQHHIQTLLTGMGRRNAEKTLRAALAKERLKLVVSSGFAGGLNPELETGTVVFEADGEPELAAALEAVGAKPARFHCAERVATTVEEKRALRAATGADAAEMESGFICAICREQGVRSAVVRVILDSAEEELPLDFNQLMAKDQRIASGKLALALAKVPAKISGLLRLQRQSSAAAKRLAEVLSKISLR